MSFITKYIGGIFMLILIDVLINEFLYDFSDTFILVFLIGLIIMSTLIILRSIEHEVIFE